MQQKEQLKKLKEGLEDEISFHEEQVKRHQEAIQRHKNRVKDIESKGKHWVLKEDWYVICHCVHGGEDVCLQDTGEETWKKSCLAVLGLGGKIILKWIRKDWVGMDWIYQSQDRGKWQVLENTVMNVRVS